MSFIEAIYRESFRPVKPEPIYEWARRNVKLDPSSPIPGYYRIENSLMFREPFDAWQDESIRNVLTIGPNQGGRTKAMEVASVWTMINRPGPSQWNTDTNTKAKDFAEERWWKTAQSVKEFRDLLPKLGDDVRKCKVMFRNGMPFVIQGANESNAEQKSVMNQFNDELFQWAQGRISTFHKRCNVSYAATYKIWDGSVAGDEGTELYHNWSASSQGEWSFRCRKCGTIQQFKWKQVKWESSEITKPKGEWNFQEVEKTVHYRCENIQCLERYDDTSLSRKVMNESAKYVHANPMAKVTGFRYNVLAVNFPGIKWSAWVIEFLLANSHFKQYGSGELLRVFWTKRMCEFYEEAKHLGAGQVRLISDYSLGDPNEYLANKWEGEGGYRIMACDRQEDYFPYVIRGVRKNGDSRSYVMGYAKTPAEIETIRIQFGVSAGCVVIDIGYERRETLAVCVTYGWTGLRGGSEDGYKHRVELEIPGTNQKTIRYIDKPYSEMRYGDPGFGTKEAIKGRRLLTVVRQKTAKYFEFSNLHIKNMLASLRSGRARVYWGVPADPRDASGKDMAQDYRDQLNSEVRYRALDKTGRATYYWSNCGRDGKSTKKENHFFDCEVMIICVMAIMGMIEIRIAQEKEEDEEKAE